MRRINVDFKLSQAQILKLYEFVEKKFVHWHDLQIEVVDHLASSIEDEMQNDATITFELALQKVYKAFGIFGFSKIVQEKQIQLAKSAKKRWWNELLGLFRLPKIISFFLLLAVLATISISVPGEILNAIFLAIYIPISLTIFIYIMRDLRLHKRLLLMHSGATYFMHPFIFEFLLVTNYTALTPLTFVILLTIGVAIKWTSFELYRKIRGEAEALYPKAFY